MSGKKISEMTAITGAQLDQTTDVVPVLDVSDTANPNKKISIQELASALNVTNASLSLDGSNNLILTDSAGNNVTADLSSFLDDTNTTNVSLAMNGNSLELSDSAASTISVDLSQFLDDTNTTNVSLAMNGNSLELSDSAASTISVDLSQFLDDTNTTNASLSLATNTLTLTDSASNSVDVDLSSLDNSGLTLADVTANGGTILKDGAEVFKIETLSDAGYLTIGYKGLADDYMVLDGGRGNSGAFFSLYNNGVRNIFLGSSGKNYVNGFLGVNITSNPTVTLDINGTDAVQLTSGTELQRPTTPANGMIRYNSDADVFEGYAGGAWVNTSGLTLADVTANGAVTSDVVTIGDAKIYTPQTNRAAFSHKNMSGIANVALWQFQAGDTVVNSPTGKQVDLSINNSYVGRVKSNGIGIFKTPSVTLDIQGTDAVQLTAGTTEEQPGQTGQPTAAAGMIRFNTTTSKFEGYDGTSWTDLN
jgi:hypothetical protein